MTEQSQPNQTVDLSAQQQPAAQQERPAPRLQPVFNELVEHLRASGGNVDDTALRLTRQLVGTAQGADLLALREVLPQLFVSTPVEGTRQTRHRFDSELDVDARFRDGQVSRDEVCAAVLALGVRQSLGRTLEVRDASSSTDRGLDDNFLREAAQLMDKVCGCTRSR